MLSWAINHGAVRLWEPHRNAKLPSELSDTLHDPFVIKAAWNAGFERAVLQHQLGIAIRCDEMIDVMVYARHLSMPGSLEDVGSIMGLPADQAKIADGQRLKQIFCEPAREAGGVGLFGDIPALFRDWSTDPDDWQKFGEYCKRDTEAERRIFKKLQRWPLPETEQRGWVLDQKINAAGMPVDLGLVHGAQAVAEQAKANLRQQLKELTGLENPNSVPQMLGWLQQHQYPFADLSKPMVTRALAEDDISSEAREALTLRKQLAKTSDSKFDAICEIVSPDGRLRNQFVFMGSSRAGRWSGRDCQLQNLPRPDKAVEKKLDLALALLTAGDYPGVCREFPSPMDVVASCIRSAFRAPQGKHFVVCDLNAIENRGLGWIAECDSILKVFRDQRCPYLSFACEMYGLKYEDLDHAYRQGDLEAKEKRQIAKPA